MADLEYREKALVSVRDVITVLQEPLTTLNAEKHERLTEYRMDGVLIITNVMED